MIRSKADESLKKLRIFYYRRLDNISQIHEPVKMDFLNLFKSYGRIIHTVSTPLLFNASWRQRVFGISRPTREPRDTTESKASRSRHDSGNSIRSRRSDSIGDFRKKSLAGEPPDIKRLSPLVVSLCNEESWIDHLKTLFIEQYADYLRKFHQCTVFQTIDKLKHHLFLEKTLRGGIIVIELIFEQNYFSVHIYALESQRLEQSVDVNRGPPLDFADTVCDLFKEHLHIHSFAHDFHLRIMFAHLAVNMPSTSAVSCSYRTINSEYYLSLFLKDFCKHYVMAPCFSQNHVKQGSIRIENPYTTTKQLYEFITKDENCNEYNFRRIHMLGGVNRDTSEYALCKKKIIESSNPDLEGFNIGVIVSLPPENCSHHDFSDASTGGRADGVGGYLDLWFWVIVTRRDIFPMFKIDYRLNKNREEPRVFPACFNECSLGTYNYLGFANCQQNDLYRVLNQELEAERECLESMVRFQMSQCRRNILWSKLMTPAQPISVDPLNYQPQQIQQTVNYLSLSEFKELLQYAHQRRFKEIDSRLSIFDDLALNWYTLIDGHSKKVYGCQRKIFSDPICNVQYMVILNQKENCFILIQIDNKTKQGDLKVVNLRKSEHNEDSEHFHEFFESFVNICCLFMWSDIM